MQELMPHLYVGTVQEAMAHLGKPGWALANVAKTGHLLLLGQKQSDARSPFYLMKETQQWISLKRVDGPSSTLFDYQGTGVQKLHAVLVFIHTHLEIGEQVLISCDQGKSRSPSVALTYLAKVLHIIPDTSFAEASSAFRTLYPKFEPGQGIAAFLASKWEVI